MENAKKIKTATLELTRTCNFQCGHCYIETTLSDGDYLNSNQRISIIEKLSNIGCRRFILTGGEALMSKSFFDVYSFIKNRELKVDIFTNGSILKESHVEVFSRNPPDSVSITTYGQTPLEYSKTTGCNGLTYSHVLKNIEKLKSLNINVSIGSIICKELEGGFCKNNESDFEFNTYLIPALHNNKNIELRLNPIDVLKIEIGNKSRDETNKKVFSSIKKIEENSEEYTKKCPGGYSSIFVSASGYASICAIYRKINFNILDEKFSISTILHKLNEIHLKFKSAYFNGKCGECELNSVCRNCPAYSLLETNSMDHNPYLCELTKLRASYYKII